MARSILENPNFSWATWNPTTWTDPVEDTTTEDVVTSPGITSMYPYRPTGGGTGGDNITPIMPRETDPFAFEDIRALAARGATGAQGVAEDDENWFQKQVAFFRDKYPNWATPVGIINALTGRKDATQSFAGGQGGVGSVAGLYQSEADLLNELMQAGFLVDTPGGVQTWSGKNPVSLMGGYEEGQRETYNLIKDRYQAKGYDTDEEIIDRLTELYGEGKTSITHRFKEAQQQIISDQIKKDRAIRNMKTTTGVFPKDVHPGTPIKTTTPKVEFVHEGAEPIPAKTVSVPVPRHISHGGGGGDKDHSPSSAPSGGRPGTTGRARDWAKGGRVRYTNGGIVGLL